MRNLPELADLPIGLFSRCLGFSSTLCAIDFRPDEFADASCLVGPQPVTAELIRARRLSLLGLDRYLDVFEHLVVERTGIGFAERRPCHWAKGVELPTFAYQVRRDSLTDPDDVQQVFDNLGAEHKQVRWIEGTTARWDGYLEFQRRPGPVLDWLAAHLHASPPLPAA